MPISQELLKKARAAGARLADAERQVQLARADYHAIVRRVHLAGGSLREVAEALELSHQRVQQIVDTAGGSWWHRVWRSRNPKREADCTFCQRAPSEVAKLIAGPNVYICDACVADAERARTGGVPATTRGMWTTAAAERARARCSFCGKRRSADRAVLTAAAGNICGECLNVCRQILTDSAA